MTLRCFPANLQYVISITSKENALIFTTYMYMPTSILHIKVKVGNKQEMAQSERNYHFKNRGRKKTKGPLTVVMGAMMYSCHRF